VLKYRRSPFITKLKKQQKEELGRTTLTAIFVVASATILALSLLRINEVKVRQVRKVESEQAAGRREF